MRWQKMAHIEFKDLLLQFGLVSHISNPVACPISKDICRIFFSSRDSSQCSKICTFDYDISNFKIVGSSAKLVLELGEIGAFDDNGLSMGCLLQTSKRVFLYYLGWNLCKNVPFRNSIGLAVADSIEGPFKRISTGPILDRNIIDPFSVSYPYVIYENGVYKMWYGSHKKWGVSTDDMIHVMKYAESDDAINWRRGGQICLDNTSEVYAYSRPAIIRDRDIYKMWYSYRGNKYRIGYAESEDGVNWNRLDSKAGIDVSADGWDSEMIEYPYVFNHCGRYFMLYNGNSYGATGMGIASQIN